MNKKALFLSVFLGAITFMAFPELSLAVTLDDRLRPNGLPTTDFAVGDNSTDSIIAFIGNIVSQVLQFAGAIAILFVMVSGGTYIFAFGDETKIDKGKRGLIWSLAGLIIIILSYSITRGVIEILLQLDS